MDITKKEKHQTKLLINFMRKCMYILATASDPDAEEIEYLNDGETEKILCLKKGTLAKWREQKKGPAYTEIGSDIRYHLNDIQYFIQPYDNHH